MAYEALNADQRGDRGPNGKTSLTIDEAAAQLTREGRSWSARLGEGATVTYAYRASAPDTMPEDTSGFGQFTSLQISRTEAALALWAGMANIRFQRVNPGGYSNDATILFGNYSSGVEDATAFAFLPGSRAASSASGDVWINSSDPDNQSRLASGSEGFATLLHEIGHAIGLTHPSDYDAEDADDISYTTSAGYFEDSAEYSIMSYFAAGETGASIDVFRRRPGGPLIDDIAAVQRLYGANRATESGDSVYGPALSNGFTDHLRHEGFLWGTIWDGGGNDTLDLSSKPGSDLKIDLNPGSFSTIAGAVGGLSIAIGTIIENAKGGVANDVLIGNSADNVLDGGGGNDRLTGGLGGDTYIGGSGNDRALLNGNVGDYLLLGGGASFMLLARNGSGDQAIDSSIETVEFRSGQYLSLRDLSAYVQGVATSGNDRIVAPATLRIDGLRFDGGAGDDRLVLGGNTGDYQLSRIVTGSNAGDIILTARNGTGTYRISEATETIEFRNGQYLSLKDLPFYIGSDATLRTGGERDDLLYQTTGGYQRFGGGGGTDTLYLRGNLQDYSGHGAISIILAPAGTSPTRLSGYQLEATNGSGSLFIQDDVETIVFQNGHQVAFNALAGTVASDPAAPGLTTIMPGAGTQNFYYAIGTNGQDRLFVDRAASGYMLGRDSGGGNFALVPGLGYNGPTLQGSDGDNRYSIGSGVETVVFADGQYLSLTDLRFYIPGNATFTYGNVGDDILIPLKGAPGQTLFGDAGFDRAYLDHDVTDYILQTFDTRSSLSPESLAGYRLVGRNGADTIDIDRSVETVHFANGQYLAFNDLPAYISDHAPLI